MNSVDLVRVLDMAAHLYTRRLSFDESIVGGTRGPRLRPRCASAMHTSFRNPL